MSFVHGPCECTDGCGTCQRSPGPAAFEVVRRDGRKLKVCTKCDLSSDKSRRLLITAEENGTPYQEWDALGFFCLVGMLGGQLKGDRGETEDAEVTP